MSTTLLIGSKQNQQILCIVSSGVLDEIFNEITYMLKDSHPKIVSELTSAFELDTSLNFTELSDNHFVIVTQILIEYHRKLLNQRFEGKKQYVHRGRNYGYIMLGIISWIKACFLYDSRSSSAWKSLVEIRIPNQGKLSVEKWCVLLWLELLVSQNDMTISKNSMTYIQAVWTQSDSSYNLDQEFAELVTQVGVITPIAIASNLVRNQAVALSEQIFSMISNGY